MAQTHGLSNPLLNGPFARILIELRWGDMDAYGHINNVTQLRLLEEARGRAFGSPTAALDPAPVAGPAGLNRTNFGVEFPPIFRPASGAANILVSAHQIEYRKPIPYREGPIAVDMVISKITPVLITIAYVIAEPDGSVAYTVAESDIVFVDPTTGRARRLQESEIEALSGFVSTPPKFKKRS